MWRLLLVVGTLTGCPQEPPPACITVDTTCSPGYVPTFDNVYKFTLSKSCGSDNGSCHSEAGHQANLKFTDMALSYQELLDNSSIDPSRKRVVPGDAACSLLIVRTDSPGKDYQMPKGDALPAAERCALLQWVQNGALQ
jgi:hypothetical protein